MLFNKSIIYGIHQGQVTQLKCDLKGQKQVKE